jgi:hypothetical protein
MQMCWNVLECWYYIKYCLYIYIYIYCAFVGVENIVYMMHGKYIKIHKKFYTYFSPVANISQHWAVHIDSYCVHD